MVDMPRWELYTKEGVYKASSWEVVLLAPAVGMLGVGATIRLGHRQVCWTEGVDGQACESYDCVANKCSEREQGNG
jgi:hypothetical protein